MVVPVLGMWVGDNRPHAVREIILCNSHVLISIFFVRTVCPDFVLGGDSAYLCILHKGQMVWLIKKLWVVCLFRKWVLVKTENKQSTSRWKYGQCTRIEVLLVCQNSELTSPSLHRLLWLKSEVDFIFYTRKWNGNSENIVFHLPFAE